WKLRGERVSKLCHWPSSFCPVAPISLRLRGASNEGRIKTCYSDPVRPAEETFHGDGARRPFLVAEGLGGNAQASRAWKGASPPKICGFSCRTRFQVRIGFLLFQAKFDGSSRQIRAANHRSENLGHGPLQFSLCLLPLCRPGKLPRPRA